MPTKTIKPSLEVAPTTLAKQPAMNFRPAVCYLQFPIQVCFSATVDHPRSCWTQLLFSSCDREPWSMTLIFKLDLNSVKDNHRAKYLGQRSSSSNVTARTTTVTFCSSTFSRNFSRVTRFLSFAYSTRLIIAFLLQCRGRNITDGLLELKSSRDADPPADLRTTQPHSQWVQQVQGLRHVLNFRGRTISKKIIRYT